QRVLVHGAGGAAAVPRSRGGGVLAQRAVVGIALGAGPTAQAVAVRRVLGRLLAVADVVGGAVAPVAPVMLVASVVSGRGGSCTCSGRTCSGRAGRRGGSAGPRLVTARGVGGVGAVGVAALGLGELLLHRAALLLDLGTLRVRIGATALGRDLLLLGRRGLLLRVQAGAVRLQLGLARLQVALLDGPLLRLRLLAQLGGAPPVGLLLPGLPALRGQRSHDDQDDQHDEHQRDDCDDDRCGQFHGRLLAVDSSARCARRSSSGYG